MTKHEILTAFRIRERLSISELLKVDDISRVALWKAVERLRRQGCLKIASVEGRERFYSITDYGLRKLAYYDEQGCGSPSCECRGWN
jgi:DNA-binding transcriptional regulator PaaX